MRKKIQTIFVILNVCLLMIILPACSNAKEVNSVEDKIKVGIMLSDVGLGDQSFSDAAFHGLVRARDELGIVFDYRELQETETYERGLTELVEAENDLVVGLGFMVQEDIEKVAERFPNQQFVLIDSVSELSNITSITFKEEQGSFLAGVVAALTTKTNKIGFIGGADVPLIRKFSSGFEQGILAINPEIKIENVFAGDFGNEKLGAKIAQDLIDEGHDVLYAAAGFTGVGVLTTAQENGIYAIGVDSDQYFYAENAVITSMLKNVDVALFQVVEQYMENNQLDSGIKQLGIQEGGIGLAPIRVIPWSSEQEKERKSWEEKVLNGEINIK